MTPTRAVELAGALDRVLPGHRVGDVQQVRRLASPSLIADELVHQLVVDVQPAGGVDDDRVEAEVASLRPARPSRARPDPSRRPDRARARPPSRRRRSAAGSPPAACTSVDTSSGCAPASSATSPSLPAVVVLPEPCSPSSRIDARPLASSLQPAFGVAEERQHLVADDLDDLLRRRAGSCRTSWSIARSRTRSTNALTTLKLTSASSSASRISRSAASTFSSVSRPRPAATGRRPGGGAERIEHDVTNQDTGSV